MQDQPHPCLSRTCKHLLELASVPQHMWRRVMTCHEHLDADCLARRCTTDQLRRRAVDSKVKAKVNERVSQDEAGLLLRAGWIEQWRVGVRHVDHRRDPASSCGTASVLPVLLVRQAWGPEVHVGVDNTGQHVTSAGVNHRACPHPVPR